MPVSLAIHREAAHVTIGYPTLNNGLDLEAVHALTNVVLDCSARDGLRFLVLHGAPEWFCIGASGATLRAAIDRGAAERIALTTSFQKAVEAILGCGLLTVAVIDGLATGAGVDLALACDLRLATPNARFSLLYSKLGLVPDTGFRLLSERLRQGDPLLLYAESPVLRSDALTASGLAEAAPEDATDPERLTAILTRRFRFDAWAFRETKGAAHRARMVQFSQDLVLAAEGQAAALSRPETQQRILRSAALQPSTPVPGVAE